MKDTPETSTPFLREIILTPGDLLDATDVPVKDEYGNVLLDEVGCWICDG